MSQQNYWFSAKQAAILEEHDPGWRTFVTVGGVEHEFTERGSGDKPSGNWDDYQLVAVGDGSETRRYEGRPSSTDHLAYEWERP